MTARVLDGRALADQLRDEVAPEVAAFTRQYGRPPGLAIVLVGENPASEVYVRNKLKTGREVGVRADLERLPGSAALTDVLELVGRLNASEVHDGILVQAPLPGSLGRDAASRVFDTIAPEKDVDGFTPGNVGRLVQGRPTLVPCTPLGIIELLTREGVPIAGRHACVIGRSEIVGKPMALLLLQRDATVTICHSKTSDLAAVCRSSDILVAAVGRTGLVTKDFVKRGATVVDVGMNTVTDASVAASLFPEGHPRLARFRERGSMLVGDVHPSVADVAGALTPVPGGVGPLTIAMLMMNTLRAARARVGASGRSPARIS
ncbi:MAG: bifunctional 5,10-methylenetetrahydrofolate dehydrogenase/5,10-methenyltetrahydrofolate cyclohydrolase [Acidobacteria bacterium]|nr:bifunctional 5,10-methylenetetrahydrofolate dehydrogenase/5,10-methenyltetrahydrofolate cyclohydrolase [Acidobacteriota bacterium]